jgi:phosphate transport system substrate-binding protein
MGFPTSIARSASIACAAATATLVAGCGADPGLTGTVRVGGSSTLLPFVQDAAAKFAEANPLSRVDVDMTGTSDGLALLCDAISGVSGASRPASARERRDCMRSGVAAVQLLVGRDAVVVFTGRDSPVPQCLSTAVLDRLTAEGPNRLTSWGRTAKGSPPLRVVVPEAGSGTRDTYIEKIIAPPAAARGSSADIRGDAIATPANQVMLSRVLGAPGAIGIAGYQTVQPWLDRVRAVGIDSGDSRAGCVSPTPASIADGSYPLTRDLYMYVDADASGENGDATRAFGDLISSPDFLRRAGSGLSDQDIADTARAWSTADTGPRE